MKRDERGEEGEKAEAVRRVYGEYYLSGRGGKRTSGSRLVDHDQAKK